MSNKLKLAAYTFSHLSVDMGCFYIIYACFARIGASTGEFALGLLTYNIIAFGFQPFIGLLADVKIKEYPIHALGSAFVLLGLCLCRSLWLALVLCALGNALFHAGAGRRVLLISGGKAFENGVFVSLGALGVALGIFLGKLAVHRAIPGALVFICAIAMLFAEREEAEIICSNKDIKDNCEFLPVTLCLLAVAVRAYIGGAVNVPWESAGYMVFVSASIVCLGKALGGFLGDRLSFAGVGTISQLCSMVFICLLGHIPFFMASGLLLFNMAMPLTLVGVYRGFKSYPGFAFGLTTLFLLLGTLPTFFFSFENTTLKIVAAVLIMLCALALYFAFGKRKETK